MRVDAREFYNGKPLFHILEKEYVKAYYRYDRDKLSQEENFREISYFLTNIHLIKIVASHHNIKVEKWRRDDFKKVEKEYGIRLFNTIESIDSTNVIIHTSKEIIEIPIPEKSLAREEMENFINLIK